MEYSIDQLENDISDIITETADLRRRKGADYAGTEDTFSDLRFLGVDYCIKRIMQKCFRVLTLLKKPPECTDEKIEQEFVDIINFALYSPIIHRQENE